MLNFLNKLSSRLLPIFILVIFLLPSLGFAQTGGPGISWNDQVVYESVGGSNFTSASVAVSGLQNPSSLLVLVLADANDNFDPAESIINVGVPPGSGVMNFNASGFPEGTFFIPVVVDASSFVGQTFNPFTDAGNFQTFVLGQVAFSAASGPNTTTTAGTNTPITTTSTTATVTQTAGSIGLSEYHPANQIENPLGQDFDIIDFLQKVFANLVKVAIPIIVIFTIYTGFLFVEARGNKEKLKTARENFLYLVVGALIILGSWTIAEALKGTVDALNQPVSFISVIISSLV